MHVPFMHRAWIALAAAFALGIGSAEDARPSFEFVETWPSETTLGHDDLRDTFDVWLEMIARAERTIDLGQFYASDAPADEGPSRLTKVVEGLETAAARGVRVRFLASEAFRSTYPDTLARLAAHEGIEVRFIDLREKTGGVLHAKYWVVDDREVFLGSQNFDYRALEHIVELGARVEDEALGAEFAALFEADWRFAGGEDDVYGKAAAAPAAVELDGAYGPVTLTPVYSPQPLLLHEGAWDLPAMVARIDAAEQRVRVQFLTYATTDREGRYFDELESALRRAAARRVQVELLVADWSKRRFVIEGLKSLQCLPNVEVRLATIPEHSAGFVPFARVIHAKFLTVDGKSAWLGTGNGNRGTFYDSRNVGLLVDGESTVAVLDRFFERVWSSDYAYTVDPAAKYEPVRTDD